VADELRTWFEDDPQTRAVASAEALPGADLQSNRVSRARYTPPIPPAPQQGGWKYVAITTYTLLGYEETRN
jgi:hypothetical protein